MRQAGFIPILVGLALATAIDAGTRVPNHEESPDITPINQLCEDFDTAWNRRDTAEIGRLFTDDADFRFHTGQMLRGRAQIERFYAVTGFVQMPAELRHETTLERVRFLNSDVAIGDGTVVLYREGASSDQEPYLRVLFTSVGQKVHDNWRIAAVRLMMPTKK